jgi:hypothetical protein
MMNLKTVFDKLFGTPAHKLVRKDDPVTSHEAAHKIDSTKLEVMVYNAIASFGEEGCISDDVLALFPFMPYSSITARYKALYTKGLIEIDGVRTGRSGKNQRVMKVPRGHL